MNTRHLAQGLCPRCGELPPALERSVCEPCGEKRSKAGRARDARLRAAGKPRRDPEKVRAAERRRYRRRVDERREAGLCVRCGHSPAAPERSLCEPCADKRRASERTRYARAKTSGQPYGGRDPEAKRLSGRERSRKRQEARRSAGACLRCGGDRPDEGGTTCERCREALKVIGRRRYAERRAAGLCGRCGRSTFEGVSRCGPCAAVEARRSPRKNAARRRLYAERRARWRCTDCGAPSQGAARCEPCARRAYERSDHFRGLPLYPPRYTVVEVATGRDHGTWDSWEEVALCLAFSGLSIDRVEVLVDQSPMASLTSWT